jgi:hypothetical protein
MKESEELVSRFSENIFWIFRKRSSNLWTKTEPEKSLLKSNFKKYFDAKRSDFKHSGAVRFATKIFRYRSSISVTLAKHYRTGDSQFKIANFGTEKLFKKEPQKARCRKSKKKRSSNAASKI